MKLLSIGNSFSQDAHRWLHWLAAENGVFIVSGIIEERANEVIDALNAAGYTIVDESYENGWYCGTVKPRRA